jgi:hypothetical protein
MSHERIPNPHSLPQLRDTSKSSIAHQKSRREDTHLLWTIWRERQSGGGGEREREEDRLEIVDDTKVSSMVCPELLTRIGVIDFDCIQFASEGTRHTHGSKGGRCLIHSRGLRGHCRGRLSGGELK